ncbi:MAG: hypothetical protein H7835_05110 [Magnetococcus sp. XQGC-1]
MNRAALAWAWLLLLLLPLPGRGEERPAEPMPREDLLPGRLFFPPEKRLQLDRMRLNLPDIATQTATEEEEKGEESSSSEKPSEVTPSEPLPPKVITGPRYVTVSGIVFKENGQHVVWVNGQLIAAQEPFEGEGFRAFPNQLDERGLPVLGEGGEQTFHLRPGQTLDLVKQRVHNAYEFTPQALKARREPPPEADKKEKEKEKEKPAKDEGAEAAKKLKGAAEVIKTLKENR